MTLHVIHFMRDINAATLSGLQEVSLSALAKGATELHIHISCTGGTTDQGFAAYHFLRSLHVPITMHCIGNIESMAVVMYLAGENRVIVPHGKIKIHALHWGFPEGNVVYSRLREYLASLDFDAERYAEIFDERTKEATEKLDVRTYLKGTAKLLDAAAAVSSGIAAKISDAVVPEEATIWWVQ